MAPSREKEQRARTFITADGSPSLYDPDLDESYHSANGAIAESKHVFIERGFYAPPLKRPGAKGPLRIFEVGFGTGINAWLTLKEAKKTDRWVVYESIEPYPLEKGTWKEITHELDGGDEEFEALHRAPWDEPWRITPRFELRKRRMGLEALKESAEAELIYYDAFGAKAHPEMWEAKMLDRALEQAGKHCIFVTYAAKGGLKRILREAGWEVEVLEGALTKREMVRGIKREGP